MVEKQRHYVMKIAFFRVPFLKATPKWKDHPFWPDLRLARQLPVNFEQLELIEALLGSLG